jgi:copper resistance protein C
MTIPYLRPAAMAVLLTLSVSFAASAHSTLKRTDPASGSVLAASPATVVIEFNEPARLIAVAVAAPGQPERKLELPPSGSATSFTIKSPGLAKGRNELKWKALSKDGHPIGGTIILVVKPGAAPQ